MAMGSKRVQLAWFCFFDDVLWYFPLFLRFSMLFSLVIDYVHVFSGSFWPEFLTLAPELRAR